MHPSSLNTLAFLHSLLHYFSHSSITCSSLHSSVHPALPRPPFIHISPHLLPDALVTSHLLSMGTLALCHIVPLCQSHSATDCEATVLTYCKVTVLPIALPGACHHGNNYATLANFSAFDSVTLLVLIRLMHEHMLFRFCERLCTVVTKLCYTAKSQN